MKNTILDLITKNHPNFVLNTQTKITSISRYCFLDQCFETKKTFTDQNGYELKFFKLDINDFWYEV